MSHFAAVLKVLRKVEKAVAFVGRLLRGLKLLLRRSDGIIALNHSYDQAARSDFRFRARDGSGRRGAAKTRDTREVQGLMHVALADVFMYGIVGDVARAAARPIAFRVESLRVVVHDGEQCVARL